MGGYKASAVYTVHDPKVYAQIVEQIKKVTQQINEIQTQIALQKQNMQDLVWGKIDPILSEAENFRKNYESMKKGMNSILSGTKDAQTAFGDTFQSFDNLDVRTTSYAEIKGRLGQNRAAKEELSKQVVTLINANRRNWMHARNGLKAIRKN